ncbi:hypothetical protein F1C58_16215 (plasmid) [Glaciihabitans sp. INWT7]|uniref:hypothetical protein n=1 Tax=Glaciihabitans sp. INWT7 TaxID=2596912 RepID=UPI0016273A1A|nr:hypothetical protein [Glaciihabitans sp. INWT7]QNE48604.1 hypothetical protein F1C58_16215 [Glaciihabitans sp. INWT7]
MSHAELDIVNEDATIAHVRASIFWQTRPDCEHEIAADALSDQLRLEVSQLRTEIMRLTAELSAAKSGMGTLSAASLFLDMERARHFARSSGAVSADR